ncbi:splicing regulator RBM11 [Hyperolius riggenbachi]|uniref:splicing regulator RBM11 n=1 Tax=Hyperolius riggenbachi TaxID=752182 RepID=UPI0035A3454F
MLSRQEETNRTLFVGNLEPKVTEELLFELFLQAGPLTKVSIAKDKEGNCKSFGFICFQHKESAPYAMSLLNGIRLFGRPIKLQYRTGSTHTSDSDSVFQGPENRSPADFGMSPAGDSFGYPPMMPPMQSTFYSQAYLYFQGMMNQFLSLQSPVSSLVAPAPHIGGLTFPQNKHFSFPPSAEPWTNYNSLPSSSSWNPAMAWDCRANQSEAGPRQEKRAAESSHSDSSDSNPPEQQLSKKQRRLEAKKRKNLVYLH